MSQVRYIFLSHNSVDKHYVEPLVEKLEQHPLALKHSIKVWLDKNNLKHGIQYPHQFAEAIESPECCAFLVFMPVESVRAYVEHEIGVAFDRQMNDKNKGKHFPLLPVYPDVAKERIPLPSIIKTYNYRENIVGDESKIEDILNDVINAIAANQNRDQQPEGASKNTGNHPEPTKPEPTKNHTLSLPLEEQWLCYDLTRENDLVTIVSPDEPLQSVQVPADSILNNFPAKGLAQKLFPEAFPDDSAAPKRLRVRSNDPQLAILPWANLHSGTVIEVSSVTTHYRPGFNKLNATNPLLVIASELQLGKNTITTNTHARVLHEYFNAYLNIQGPIPCINNRKSLLNALEFHKPDFLYLCANMESGEILLDRSDFQTPDEKSSITLDELGEWLQGAELRPVVVVSLFGEALAQYPKVLADSCRLLWVQSSSNKSKSKPKAIEDVLVNTLEQLEANGDFVALVRDISAKDRTIQQNLWINGQSPQIDTKGLSLIHRLRAAFLRVLLGREALKGSLYNEVKKPNNLDNRSCLAYVVTGDEASCPFDVPAQLQQRLDEDNDAEKDNGLPILNFPMTLNIDVDEDAEDTLTDIFDGCLVDRYNKIDETFYNERERRGYLKRDCIIAISWSVNLPAQSVVVLSDWIEAWADQIRDEILPHTPPRTVLLNALCIQTADPDVAQQIQDTANKTLQPYRRHGIRLIHIPQALGKLEYHEILNFFEDHPHWQETLKFDTYDIDLYDYTDWIYQRTQEGEFEATINTIWQQYQNDYNDYQA